MPLQLPFSPRHGFAHDTTATTTMSLPLIFKRGLHKKPLHRALPRIPDPLKTSTRATTWDVAPGVTFTHRPPPTAPSPFSLTAAPASPLLILGKRTPAAASSSTEEIPLPPTLHKPPREKVEVPNEVVAEIRRLRREDPQVNLPSILAKQFGVTPWYVRIVAPLPRPLARKHMEEEFGKQGREKWGYRKRLIRETRQKRRNYWSNAPPK
ncbi:hypothetical protein CALVIDRAFT_556859 [Calocera viscosa TUFC12733]|uniref:Mitochondrial ribosomal protein subunit L20-domain-containing protein n=1 Tax=Calocera viscosa (strain TUFC12733) TaxID=1330018 RepID=A0A167JIH8_CALVF|nr:hypothetical protein CALVIDRAFT_556859 [Calocera viscosa TUFC12733]